MGLTIIYHYNYSNIYITPSTAQSLTEVNNHRIVNKVTLPVEFRTIQGLVLFIDNKGGISLQSTRKLFHFSLMSADLF